MYRNDHEIETRGVRWIGTEEGKWEYRDGYEVRTRTVQRRIRSGDKMNAEVDTEWKQKEYRGGYEVGTKGIQRWIRSRDKGNGIQK